MEVDLVDGEARQIGHTVVPSSVCGTTVRHAGDVVVLVESRNPIQIELLTKRGTPRLAIVTAPLPRYASNWDPSLGPRYCEESAAKQARGNWLAVSPRIPTSILFSLCPILVRGPTASFFLMPPTGLSNRKSAVRKQSGLLCN